jgi:hypothetical protein
MVFDVFLPYNITEFLRALAYFLSNAFALRGSFCACHSFWRKAARNPTELIGEFQLTNFDRALRGAITELHSFRF